MTRQRLFLDINCVEAARQRMRHVYDTFDTVCIQFSGGKDSTAILLLAKEVHEERGLGPVKVIFRDEEMVSPAVIEYVEYIRSKPWVDMEWYCLAHGSEIWVLGHRQSVILWSEKRQKEGRLVREMPPFAISAKSFGISGHSYLPEHPDYYTMQGKKGNVAFVTGVRANESMVRYRSLVQKLHENYIVTPYKMKRKMPLKFAKVIYDWQAADVFKFIVEEHNERYCEYYDRASVTGSNSRVGIPLHAVAIRRLGDVVATEPEFYDKLVEVFPYIDAQYKYWPSFNTEKLISKYSKMGWSGVHEFIDEYMIGETNQQRAMSFAAEFRRKHMADPKSYTIYSLVNSLFMHSIASSMAATPIGPKTRVHSMREIDSTEITKEGL